MVLMVVVVMMMMMIMIRCSSGVCGDDDGNDRL